MEKRFDVEWADAGVDPKHPPDPRYPKGIDIDVSVGVKPACKVDLPYPAARCGAYIVRCLECDRSVSVTTAGRIDDPRSVTLPCKKSLFAIDLTKHERRIAAELLESYVDKYKQVRDILMEDEMGNAAALTETEMSIELLGKILGGLNAIDKREALRTKR